MDLPYRIDHRAPRRRQEPAESGVHAPHLYADYGRRFVDPAALDEARHRARLRGRQRDQEPIDVRVGPIPAELGMQPSFGGWVLQPRQRSQQFLRCDPESGAQLQQTGNVHVAEVAFPGEPERDRLPAHPRGPGHV